MDKKETILRRLHLIERLSSPNKKLIFLSLTLVIIGLTLVGSVIAGVSFKVDSLEKGLVGHWPLDSAHLNSATNQVDDISGYGNHGTNSGAISTTDRYGQANGAMSFISAESDYINISDNARLSSSQTITFWYKHSTGSIPVYQGILGGNSFSGGIDKGHAIGIWTAPSLDSDIYSGDPYGNHRSSLSIAFPQDTDWHFVVSSYSTDTNTHTLYLDETVTSRNPNFLTHQIDWGSTPFKIGNTGNYFDGSIQDVRTYNRVLSTNEITRLYESYKPKMSVGSLNKGLFSYYSFDNFGEWTENLAPFTDYSNRTYEQGYTAGSWGGDVATIYYYENGGYNNLPYKKMIKSIGGTRGSYLFDNQYITIEDNKTYTISAWMKASRNQIFNGHLLNINRASDNAYRLGGDISLSTEWERYSWVYNSGTGHAGEYQTRHIIYIDDDLPLEIYWSGFQVEEKAYITPFISGTRNDYTKDNSGYESHAALDSNTPKWIEQNGVHKGCYEFFKGEEKRIQLPDPFLYTKTISFWVKIKEGEHTSAEAVPFLVYNDGTITGSGDSNQILLCMQNNKFRMHGWGSSDPICSTDINDGEWHHLVWHMNYHASDANQRLMNMWVDGIKEVSNFNYSQGSFPPVAGKYWWVGYNSRSYSAYLRDSGIIINDIRFYDHILSDGGVSVGQNTKGEIASLYAKGRSGSSIGMTTGSLNKGLILDMPLKSRYGKTEGTVNLAPSGQRTCASAFSRQSAHRQTYSYSQLTNVAGRDDVTRIYINPTTGDNPYADWGFSAYKSGGSEVSDVYAISFDYKMLKGTGLPYLSTTYKDGYKTPDSSSAASLGSATTTNLGSGWYRYNRTATITLAGTTWWRFHQSSNNVETEFYVDNFQIEKKNYVTPFIDGTRFDKTSDTTPNSNHGTIYGATVGTNFTTFDGNDYISLPNFNVSNTAFTASFWFNANTAAASNGLLDFGTYENNGFSIFFSDTTNLYYRVNWSGGKLQQSGGIYLSDWTNKWYNVVMVYFYNGSNIILKMYIDGELEQTISSANQMVSPTVNPRIGLRDSSYFNGSISNVKIYNRALSKNEITSLFDKERGQFGI